MNSLLGSNKNSRQWMKFKKTVAWYSEEGQLSTFLIEDKNESTGMPQLTTDFPLEHLCHTTWLVVTYHFGKFYKEKYFLNSSARDKMTSRKCGKCGVEVASVNIYVCPKGHVSCVTCKEKRCSECWRSGRNERKRNKVMKVADKEKIPCQNAKRGCPVKIPKGDPHKHETECLFK